MELPLVLLVEDDEDDLVVLEHSFSKLEWPCQLMTFRNGESVLAFLKNTSSSPALILLDQRMPGLLGMEVLELLRDLPCCQHTRTIIMTGDAPASFIDEVGKTGGCSYLQKPFTITGWQQVLYQIIQGLPD